MKYFCHSVFKWHKCNNILSKNIFEQDNKNIYKFAAHLRFCKTKMLSASGELAPDLLNRGSAPGPPLGALPRPVIGSHSTNAMSPLTTMRKFTPMDLANPLDLFFNLFRKRTPGHGNNWYACFYTLMPFLSPTRQCQSTKGNICVTECMCACIEACSNYPNSSLLAIWTNVT